MNISNYNLIRVILDIMYEDHKMKEKPDWKSWLHSISRIYHHKIPSKLLHALIQKNNSELSSLCSDKLMEQYKLYIKNESHILKYDNWIKRRDEGNRKAHIKVKEYKELQLKEQLKFQLKDREKQEEINNNMEHQMMLLWKSKLDNIIQKRSEQNDYLFKNT